MLLMFTAVIAKSVRKQIKFTICIILNSDQEKYHFVQSMQTCLVFTDLVTSKNWGVATWLLQFNNKHFHVM